MSKASGRALQLASLLTRLGFRLAMLGMRWDRWDAG